MGYSDLGCYGSEIATPNLDKLAAAGIRYTRMYNTSKCYPTRAALLTGNYFQHTDREFPNTATAGEVLRPAGYHTWWSGKHHADFNPHGRGFDHFFGFLGGAVNFWNPGGQDKKGKAVPGAVYSWAFDDKIVNPFIPEKGFHCTDAFTDWGLGQLDNTLILFLADNGASPERPKKPDVDPDAEWGSVGSFESIGRAWANVCDTPLRKWKATSHEGGINTPMIAHWPNGIEAPGTVNRQPCHLIDLLPTWMELAAKMAGQWDAWFKRCTGKAYVTKSNSK